MSGPAIFRKSSLERSSTPERLDCLMQVTTPKLLFWPVVTGLLFAVSLLAFY